MYTSEASRKRVDGPIRRAACSDRFHETPLHELHDHRGDVLLRQSEPSRHIVDRQGVGVRLFDGPEDVFGFHLLLPFRVLLLLER